MALNKFTNRDIKAANILSKIKYKYNICQNHDISNNRLKVICPICNKYISLSPEKNHNIRKKMLSSLYQIMEKMIKEKRYHVTENMLDELKQVAINMEFYLYERSFNLKDYMLIRSQEDVIKLLNLYINNI